MWRFVSEVISTCVSVVQKHSSLYLQSLNHDRMQQPSNLFFSPLEEDQRCLQAAQAASAEQVGLWGDLCQSDGEGPQPSGVNLSDCQAKYCKSLAITETVKGQMQFPELFTQLEAPPPLSELPRIGRIKVGGERGRVGF